MSNSIDYNVSQLEKKRYFCDAIIVFSISFFIGNPFSPGDSSGNTRIRLLGDRITSSDPFILILIGIFVLSLYKDRFILPRYSRAFFMFWICSIITIIGSPYLSTHAYYGISEICIYLYLYITSVVFFNIFLNKNLRNIATWGIIIGTLFSLLLAYCIKYLGFPNFPQHSSNLQGTFRNGAQLGAYLYYVALLLIPLYFYDAKDLQKKLILVTLSLIPISIFLSSKRSAIAAFSFLAVLTVLYYTKNNKVSINTALFFIIMVIFAGFSYLIFLQTPDEEQDYFLQRSSVLLDYSSRSDFHVENRQFAFDSFRRNPISGNGISMSIGGFSNVIHNSYLVFIGEGGILLMFTGPWLFYAMGMFGPIKKVAYNYKTHHLINFYRTLYLSVFVINYWAYGFRRREVWFIVAFMEAIKYSSTIEKNIKNKNSI